MNFTNEQTHSLRIAAMFFNLGKIQVRIEGGNGGKDEILKKSCELVSEQLSGLPSVKGLVPSIISHLSNPEDQVFKILRDADFLAHQQSHLTSAGNESLQPLTSLSSRIKISDEANNDANQIVYHLPKCIDLATVMPGQAASQAQLPYAEIKLAYKNLLDGFKKELSTLPTNTINGFTDSLLFLFEKYFCYVPVSVNAGETDVSLYDHCRSVTAITECLVSTENPGLPFLLMTADISGIQNFIYNDENPVENSTKGTSKRLRGKSFYLILLTDTLSSIILSRMGISRANLLMNGGGHFIILAPNTARNMEIFDNLKIEFGKFLFEKFAGKLHTVMASVEADTNLYSDFSAWYAQLNDALLSEKGRKMIDFLESAVETNIDTFRPAQLSYGVKGDDNQDHKNLNEYQKYLYANERMFEELGRGVSKASFFVFCQSAQTPDLKKNDLFRFTPVYYSQLGASWFAAESNQALQDLLRIFSSLNDAAITVFRMNSADGFAEVKQCISQVPISSLGVSIGFRFNGTYSPDKKILENFNQSDSEDESESEFEEFIDNNGGESYRYTKEDIKKSPLEFEKLALLSEQEELLSYPLLGVLRLDVDNLGAVFIFGFKKGSNQVNDIYSLSRNAGLSRELNLFFCGYVNLLAKKHHIYITYSGGDDLFVVGSWVNIIEFSKTLHEEFNKLSGNNKQLTLSAGIHLCKPNFPVVKAARLAGEAEECSKKAKNKNALTLFEKTAEWNDQLKLIGYGKQIFDLIKDNDAEETEAADSDTDTEPSTGETNRRRKRVNASFIHLLLGYTSKMFDKEGGFLPDRYYLLIGKIKYMFARGSRKMNKMVLEENLRPEVKVLGQLINSNDSIDRLKHFKVPASYAILRNRKSKK